MPSLPPAQRSWAIRLAIPVRASARGTGLNVQQPAPQVGLTSADWKHNQRHTRFLAVAVRTPANLYLDQVAIGSPVFDSHTRQEKESVQLSMVCSSGLILKTVPRKTAVHPISIDGSDFCVHLPPTRILV
jgi:hypothetical protein